MKESKETKIVMDAYREIYKNANPPADFDKLLKDAEEVNGMKTIAFNDYEIDPKIFKEILDRIGKKYRLNEFNRKRLSITMHLGATPRFIKTAE